MLIEVRAGTHERKDTPVLWPAPPRFQDCPQLTITDLAGKPAGPIQLVPGPAPQFVWILQDTIPRGESRRYRVSRWKEPARPGVQPQLEDEGQLLTVRIGSQPVLKYRHAPDPGNAPKGATNLSGYIHPIFSPGGPLLTAEYYEDHMHQHGVMMSWADATFDGEPVDVWNGQNAHIEHGEFQGRGAGPACAYFRSLIRHVTAGAPGAARTLLRDSWTVRVYNFRQYYLFDLESTQAVPGANTYQVQQQVYGGLTLRGALAWREGDAWQDAASNNFLTSEGKDRTNANDTRPRWVDLHGATGGRIYGVTVFSHPTNFRFPQPVRLRPEKPYFCFAVMALGPFTIDRSHPLVSRYRYWAHSGLPDRAVADRLWNDFADPPAVRILEAR